MLFLGRLTIGAGSAFAFVGMAQIVRSNFPLKQYAFMIGLSETLGFVLTVFAMLGMGSFIINYGWRTLINGAGIVGLLIACLLWVFIPSNKTKTKSTGLYKAQFMLILNNKLIWINGIFVCLEFSVITVFSSLWAIPFLQLKLNSSLKVTSILTSMLLLGAGLSCPLFGLLSMRMAKRKPLIHASCLTTAALFLLILYIPSQNLVLMGLIMFAIGLSCGAYMLAYTISNELAPPQALSTCTGFTNTLAMLSAPILQPLVGYLLDHLAVSPGVYSLENYQTVLLIIPAALILASYLTRSLPEKR